MKYFQINRLKLVVGVWLTLVMGLTYGAGGQSGSGRFFGEITAFGSIFVNGVEYNISTANIIINGVPATQADLKLGMAVRVDGIINSGGLTGTATTVEFLGDIEGAIDAAAVINGTNGVLHIYGLVINTDGNTKYNDGVTLASLIAGDIVEVSGFFNANDGSFTATRIEKQATFTKVELRGFISNVTATTFVLGPSLVVNYSGARPQDIPPGGYQSGTFVEVKATAAPVNGTLTATRASVEVSILASTSLPLGVVKGVAANVTASGFAMGNQPIVIDSNTVFTDAALSALTSGVKAIAAGPVSNGVMNATAVSITPALVSVRSQKIHGTAGVFNLPIVTSTDISGAVTVEPRVIGSGHTIIFQFSSPISSVAGVTSRDASGLNNVGTATFAIPAMPGNEVVVTLTGVPNSQRARITINNINATGSNVAASIGFLVGDVNNTRAVDAGDASGVKARSGQIADGSNFMFDVNVSGAINVSDIMAVKARSGQVLQ